ncbi:hypothetical protein DVK85_00175 [Flavobacterium arcticum]|uniref:Outer membrane protein beta-barrel domain-containing protein n=1 Tax=Flavobacterium arcticum TaxID=1784713 RepID=A0A345H821_9FLAO|nr:hypothetical protein [Flavobacterium arcticum]AXG72731.1 hypothetical protein DVK85_00175 [Flavobacterium arcticum]KAF2510998.1 hypothetical protein E0W72_06290 [Flavobacterium arcticum]
MKFVTFLAVLLTAFSMYAQNENQQQGYYITNDGQRVDGYFKTTDFYDTESLGFKEQSTGESFSAIDVNDISEYGIGKEFKFIKKIFEIDNSETNFKRLSSISEPDWVETTGFLNVILEGEVSLYSYSNSKGTKFFYSTPSKDIQQLLYKRYRPSEAIVAENNLYLQQLLNNVRCENEDRSFFATISYGKKDLIRVFKKYNECNGNLYTVYNNSTSKGSKINFTVFAAANYYSFGIKGSGSDSEVENVIAPTLGLEVALVLPSEKWEFFGKVEFESLSAKTKAVYDRGFGGFTVENYDIDMQAINLQFGLRYNAIVKGYNKFFIDGALGVTKPFGDLNIETISSTTDGSASTTQLRKRELGSSFCGNIGVGYMYKNKFGAAIRYETARNLFSNGGMLTTDISRIGLNLRYTLN